VTTQLKPVAETFDVKNPATGELVGSFPVHSAADIAQRLTKARDAQQWWAGLGFAARKKRMLRWVRWLARDCDTLYDLGFRETGKPKPDVQFELLAGLEDIRWAATHAKRVLGERKVAPGLASKHAPTALRTLRRRSSASCSTHPGAGNDRAVGAEPRATISPSWATSSALVELEPWSTARISSSGIPDQLSRRSGDAFGGQPEVFEEKGGAARRCEGPRHAKYPHRGRAVLSEQ